MRRIVCFGPGPKFKGGISNYNTALAKALDQNPGVEVHIISWTQQYPSIIPREFVDKKSTLDFLEGTKVKVRYLTNYNNPASWKRTYKAILEIKPEKVIFQWAIALQGLPLSYIAKKLKRADIEVIFDLHFVIQKENSKIDQYLTKRALKHADTFIAHAFKTHDELKEIFPGKALPISLDGKRAADGTTVIKLFHPIYDLFQPDPAFDVDEFKEKLGLRSKVFLFFGFIRKYKGLHFAIEAFEKVYKDRKDVSFLICGESFWNTLDDRKLSTKLKQWTFGLAKKIFLKKDKDERSYDPLALIKALNIEAGVVVKNEFVPNEDVHKYFQVSDAVVLFYEYATPSGIESLSYNFLKPLLATKVGHFGETIEDGVNGYLAEPEDTQSMADQMIRFLDSPLDPNNVRSKTKEMSWQNYAQAILND